MMCGKKKTVRNIENWTQRSKTKPKFLTHILNSVLCIAFSKQIQMINFAYTINCICEQYSNLKIHTFESIY